MNASSTQDDVEIAIVGGGLVGASVAIALGQAGFSVAVIDRLAPKAQIEPAFDGRASAIALAPQRMLDRLGVWEKLAPDATPILDIRVADNNSPLFLHYDSAEIGAPALGYMLENRHIRRALFESLSELSNIRFKAPMEIRALAGDGAKVRLDLADGTSLRADLIVGADGRTSTVRTLSGLATHGWAYRQTGIVCTVVHEKPHHNVAIEHFLPAGPFAILPLTGNRSSLVWTERAELAPDILALPPERFLAELEMRFGDFLGALALEGPVWSYPLEMHLAERTVAPRVALAGDAAHGMHPIAGQGFNLGLRDVAALAETIVEAARLGLDIGAADTLARYAEWRRLDTLVMLGLTDGLNRLFSNDIAPVRLARDLGLAAVNATGPLKRFFMRHAMGLTMGMAQGGSSTLPRLLRGEAL